MARKHWALWLLVAFAILEAAPLARATPLTANFDTTGLSALTLQSSPPANLFISGNVEMQDLQINNQGVAAADFSPGTARFDQQNRIIQQRYAWGTIRLGYKPDPDNGALHLALAIDNTSSRTITRMSLFLLRWKLPGSPTNGWNGADLLLHDRDDDFPLITAHYQGGRAVIASDDINLPAIFGIQPLGHDTEAIVYRITDAQPIRPGEQRKAMLSIRVGADGDSTESLEGDVLHAYAKKYPSELNWPDHRPIGSTFLSTSVAGYKHNPRGWFFDSELNVFTDAGKKQFANELWKYADAVIAHSHELNAQGVIVWDIEGQEMPHATSYLADPRMLSQVAPEMQPLADKLFRKFKDAGLRVGVTIRPTRVVRSDHGPGWMQQDVSDWVAEMDAKMTYAQKRWGCTLFYCDSNVTFIRDANGKILSDPAMPAEYFHILAKRHPDCLLMPEHKTSRYWAYTAPYSEYRLGFKGTSEEVRIAYPNAFSVMQVVDGPKLSDPDSIKTLTTAISHGDILLFRPWWDDPQTPDILHLYQLAPPRGQ